MAIQVDPEALAASAKGYQDAATAVGDLHTGLTSALDKVASAAANQHVAAGTASLHTGVSGVLTALTDGSNRFATKVTQAAAAYRSADTLGDGAAASRGVQYAQAGTTMNDASPAGATMTRADFEARKKYFADLLARMDPKAVARWVTGKTGPPAEVMAEIRTQHDAMLAAMRTVTGKDLKDVSNYRSYADQKGIWTRKYNFDRTFGKFGKVTPEAAKLTGKTAGSEWDTKTDADAWAKLSSEQKQIEILQTSSGPGISRHHWGTEYDLGSVNNRDFQPTGQFGAQYTWMQRNADQYGFEQTYTAGSATDKIGYTEERWHWSYAPAAQAMQDWAATNRPAVEQELTSGWGNDPKYSYLKSHFEDYMQNTDQTGPLHQH